MGFDDGSAAVASAGVPHDRVARPWLKAITAFVTLSRTTTVVSVKHRFIQRS